MKPWKVLVQILIDILVMVALVCLMAHLINIWELDVVASSLFGILTGVVIVITGYIVYIIFYER